MMWCEPSARSVKMLPCYIQSTLLVVLHPRHPHPPPHSNMLTVWRCLPNLTCIGIWAFRKFLGVPWLFGYSVNFLGVPWLFGYSVNFWAFRDFLVIPWIFPKILPFIRMWLKHGGDGQPQMTLWRMRIACWITKDTDTLRICNAYCFSAAKMVMWTRFNITLDDVSCLVYLS